MVLFSIAMPLFTLILKKTKIEKIRENLETYIFHFERFMTFHKGCGGIGILIGFVLVCQNLNDLEWRWARKRDVMFLTTQRY